MSRVAIYQLFRRIPDADDSAVDAAIEALATVSGERMVAKQDLAELRSDLKADIRLTHWIVGILTAILIPTLLGLFWMQLNMVDRMARLDERVVTLNERVVALNERVVTLDERVVALDERLDKMEANQTHMQERLERIEQLLVERS